MEPKTQKNLEQAKAYFYSLKLAEAYNILRRYYDRLPFAPEKEHAEYISIFVRTLVELGKEFELNFYLGELEKISEKSHSIPIAFQLAVVYQHISEPRFEASKRLLEEIIRDPSGTDYQAKAKITLARYYDIVHQDYASCRRLIDSITNVQDPGLLPTIEIWKGIILREEGHLGDAEAVLTGVIENPEYRENWAAFFPAMPPLVNVYIRQGRREKAAELLATARKLFEGHNVKSIKVMLDVAEKNLHASTSLGPLKLTLGETEEKLTYENKSLSLNEKTASDKLLLLLAKRGYLDKAFIVKSLYARSYDAKRDDKLIYYHIHSLRKRLRQLGLPSEAITKDEGGYRFVPEVETLGEEL